MLTWFFRLLGVTPNHGKTGKRESAWTLVLIALVLTVTAMWLGIEMVQAMTAVLIGVWGPAIAFVGYAYKLEHDKTAGGDAHDWPEGVASQGLEWQPGDHVTAGPEDTV